MQPWDWAIFIRSVASVLSLSHRPLRGILGENLRTYLKQGRASPVRCLFPWKILSGCHRPPVPSPHCPRLSVGLRSRWRAVANGPAHISWPARVLASFISFHYSRFLYLVEDFLYNKSEMPAQISADVVTTSRLARATKSDVI